MKSRDIPDQKRELMPSYKFWLPLKFTSLSLNQEMSSTNIRPRTGAYHIILDEDNVMINGNLDHRGNLVHFEARKGFVLPVITCPTEHDPGSQPERSQTSNE
jgi:hypothetical protein